MHQINLFLAKHALLLQGVFIGVCLCFFVVLIARAFAAWLDRRQFEAAIRRRKPRPPAAEWQGKGRSVRAQVRSDDRFHFTPDPADAVRALGPHQRRALRDSEARRAGSR